MIIHREREALYVRERLFLAALNQWPFVQGSRFKFAATKEKSWPNCFGFVLGAR